jgi:hypothetical protein
MHTWNQKGEKKIHKVSVNMLLYSTISCNEKAVLCAETSGYNILKMEPLVQRVPKCDAEQYKCTVQSVYVFYY